MESFAQFAEQILAAHQYVRTSIPRRGMRWHLHQLLSSWVMDVANSLSPRPTVRGWGSRVRCLKLIHKLEQLDLVYGEFLLQDVLRQQIKILHLSDKPADRESCLNFDGQYYYWYRSAGGKFSVRARLLAKQGNWMTLEVAELPTSADEPLWSAHPQKVAFADIPEFG